LHEALEEGARTDRSYIEFLYSRLYLDELYAEVDRFRTPPLVMLNMCESAQLSPTLSDSFVNFFLDRGAPTVIGTESPMTVTFAHAFAESLLTGIFRGQRAGAAILATRQQFLSAATNPLGLAYTLYGSAATRFRPPPLATTPSGPPKEETIT
jgi:hypothetical protein